MNRVIADAANAGTIVTLGASAAHQDPFLGIAAVIAAATSLISALRGWYLAYKKSK